MKKNIIIAVIVTLILCSCSKREDEQINFYYISRDMEYNFLIEDLVAEFADENGVSMQAISYYHDELTSILGRDSLKWDIIEIQSSDYSSLNLDSCSESRDSLDLPSVYKTLNHPNYKVSSVPYLLELPYLYINPKLLGVHDKDSALKLIQKYYKNPFEFSLNNKNLLAGLPVFEKHESQKYLIPLLNFLSNNSQITPVSLYNLLNLNKISYFGTQNEVENAFLNCKVVSIIAGSGFENRLNSVKLNFLKIPLFNPDNNSMISEGSLIATKNVRERRSSYLKFLKYFFSKEIQLQIKEETNAISQNVFLMPNSMLLKGFKGNKINFKLIYQVSYLNNQLFQSYLIDMIYGKYAPEYFYLKITEQKK